jgi:hypothetical protein
VWRIPTNMEGRGSESVQVVPSVTQYGLVFRAGCVFLEAVILNVSGATFS